MSVSFFLFPCSKGHSVGAYLNTIQMILACMAVKKQTPSWPVTIGACQSNDTQPLLATKAVLCFNPKLLAQLDTLIIIAYCLLAPNTVARLYCTVPPYRAGAAPRRLYKTKYKLLLQKWQPPIYCKKIAAASGRIFGRHKSFQMMEKVPSSSRLV